MRCIFLEHGIALKYNNVALPCCSFKPSNKWIEDNNIMNIDLVDWHNKQQFVDLRQILQNNEFPEECNSCKNIESLGRKDSVRLSGYNSYKDYTANDLMLEIRPGNTCNLSCFTCWPEASSQIHQQYKLAGLLDENYESIKHDTFDYLLPVAHKIKDVVLLGGEPFYDKNCKKFLAWAKENLKSNLTIFTNGSNIDFDFIENYNGKLNIVFSIDAVGDVNSYVRYGSDWQEIYSSYKKLINEEKITVAVNITESVYNIYHMHILIDFFLDNYPSYMTFGLAEEPRSCIDVIPVEFRKEIISNLQQSIKKVMISKVERNQKINTVNSLRSMISRLEKLPWNKKNFETFKKFTLLMNNVKGAKFIPDFIRMICDYETKVN